MKLGEMGLIFRCLPQMRQCRGATEVNDNSQTFALENVQHTTDNAALAAPIVIWPSMEGMNENEARDPLALPKMGRGQARETKA